MSLPLIQIIRNAFVWQSGFAVDADGAYKAYHPQSGLGLDNLGNAHEGDRWFGVVTNSSGLPIVQGPNDPAPGYYVSPTALCDRTKLATDPLRYVDSSTVPYLSVPPELRNRGVMLGDVAMVCRGGKLSGAIVADVGPHNKIGEGSIALATALEIPSNARNGGISWGVTWLVFRASATGWPRTVDSIQAQALTLFEAWGGSAALTAINY